ncbi:MAG TPA: hypothetical protein VFY84_14955 [Jiangellales bacterium]|nr:hypothetical protein [Jiangellales bacterium]
MKRHDGPTVCARCGTPAGDQVPLDWVLSTEGGRRLYYCPSCARENLRAIEAKLDSADW